MVGDAADSIVLIWIKAGEHPGSPGVSMDHTEHFYDLRHALSASADPARYSAEKLPWIKTRDRWMSPDEIRQAAR
jgi:hypothetical protein